MALLTANEVITHVAWLALAPRLPEIVGSETLAIVVSSTCMNDASASPIVASARFGGRNGIAPGAAAGEAGGGPASSAGLSTIVDIGQRLPCGRLLRTVVSINASASASCFA